MRTSRRHKQSEKSPQPAPLRIQHSFGNYPVCLAIPAEVFSGAVWGECTGLLAGNLLTTQGHVWFSGGFGTTSVQTVDIQVNTSLLQWKADLLAVENSIPLIEQESNLDAALQTLDEMHAQLTGLLAITDQARSRVRRSSTGRERPVVNTRDDRQRPEDTTASGGADHPKNAGEVEGADVPILVDFAWTKSKYLARKAVRKFGEQINADHSTS